MDITWWEFGCGILGFVGFECLRIYKVLWAGGKIVPSEKPMAYTIILLGISVFSGVIAHAFATGSVPKAMMVGFSVPSGIKAFTDKAKDDDSDAEEHHADDIPPESDISSRQNTFKSAFLHYFQYRYVRRR